MNDRFHNVFCIYPHSFWCAWIQNGSEIILHLEVSHISQCPFEWRNGGCGECVYLWHNGQRNALQDCSHRLISLYVGWSEYLPLFPLSSTLNRPDSLLITAVNVHRAGISLDMLNHQALLSLEALFCYFH